MKRLDIITLGLGLTLTLHAAQQDREATFFEANAARDTKSVVSMLEQEPALASARRPSGASAVTAATFAIAKGENSFHAPGSNEVLKAILAKKPHLDIFDTAAVGTTEALAEMLRLDPEALARRTRFGWTLLHLAAFGGNAASVELLLQKGSDVHARAESRFRNTPLQTALLCGQFATASLLLDHGADVLVRQSKGATPMHEAALLGRLDLVRLLLDHGAEINSVSDNGQTPLAEALRGHHDDLAAWMKGKGAVVGTQPDEDVPLKK